MDKIMIVLDTEEARDGRVELIRREFNVPLLEAERIEKQGYAIANDAFDVFSKAEDAMRDGNDASLLRIMVHALRIVAVNTDMCAAIINQAIPCECPDCRAARGRMN